ncbi:DMT family transporter [Epibacterium ulvae]|uniref:DMT family transporter n=1 Tax=Epibacterium ulvae TaxID=1156985 RepID=UPI001BFC37FC|nr:DMT family transporter [Epibacterium ulvae]MBT8152697.1 DMT family transporter [Epibacterium ulvae]
MTCVPETTAGASSVAPASRTMLIGIGLIVLAGGFLAVQDATVKEMTARLSPFQISFLRYGWHAIFVALYLTSTGHRSIYVTAQFPLQVARALTLVGGSLAFHVAISVIPLSQATVILFLSPLIVTLLSVVFLKERIGWRRTTALCLGFMGVVVVISPQLDGGAGLSLIWLLPLIAACGSACYVLLTQRLTGSSEFVPALALMPLLCSLALVPMQPFVWQPISTSDFIVIMGLGVTGTLAHVCIQFGMRVASASVLAPFLYSQVVFAAVLGLIFFDEVVGLGFVLGTLLIVGAGLVIWWIERPRPTPETRRKDIA